MKAAYLFRILAPLCLISVLLTVNCKEDSAGPGAEIDISQYTREELDSLSLSSLRRVDDYPLYMMTYYGDYGFDEYLETGIQEAETAVSHQGVDREQWGCTCFVAMGDGREPIFGRNFDWHDCIPLFLFTRPPGGFASVSMVDMEYLGFHRDRLPETANDKTNLLNAPWIPFDGINEKGVAIGMMAISHAEPPENPDNITIDEIQLIRLVLDHAENVDHALSLIRQYNIRMLEPPIHYLIADTSGRSVIVEFVNGEMIVMPNDEPWQVSTNFIIHGSDAPERVDCWRYRTAYDTLQSVQGSLTIEGAMDVLQRVSQPESTIWSMVYEITAKRAHTAVGRNYDTVHTFRLE